MELALEHLFSFRCAPELLIKHGAEPQCIDIEKLKSEALQRTVKLKGRLLWEKFENHRSRL